MRLLTYNLLPCYNRATIMLLQTHELPPCYYRRMLHEPLLTQSSLHATFVPGRDGFPTGAFQRLQSRCLFKRLFRSQRCCLFGTNSRARPRHRIPVLCHVRSRPISIAFPSYVT